MILSIPQVSKTSLNKTMASMFNSRWAKMEKYYNLIDESPAYIAAIVLNLNSKWKYIESN
jgi:hypothetical protein